MSFGIFIGGSIMTILSLASFDKGGVWNIAGVACMMAWIGCSLYFYFSDNKINNKYKGGI